jgi:hypothetical protein
MKKVIALLSTLMVSAVFAQVNPEVINTPLGSGNASFGKQKATEVYSGIYHVPMYMPGYPTASVLWPTVITVECGEGLKDCASFDYQPSYGRGEYIFFKPVFNKTQQRLDAIDIKIEGLSKDMGQKIDNIKPLVILKEVPAKKNRE